VELVELVPHGQMLLLRYSLLTLIPFAKETRMAIYNVGIREVHVLTVRVGLTDEEEKLPLLKKLKLVRSRANFERESIDDYYSEYSHDLEQDYWSVEKVG